MFLPFFFITGLWRFVSSLKRVFLTANFVTSFPIRHPQQHPREMYLYHNGKDRGTDGPSSTWSFPLADPWTYLQAWPQCFSPDFHASWSGCGMDLVEEAERLWLAAFSCTRGPDSSWGFTVTTNPFFMRPRKKKETLYRLMFCSHS